MKMGDVVRFMGGCYRVGSNMTETSIELVELKRPLIGLWVSRDEVREVAPENQGSEQHALA